MKSKERSLVVLPAMSAGVDPERRVTRESDGRAPYSRSCLTSREAASHDLPRVM
jgi:hypothetical protein